MRPPGAILAPGEIIIATGTKSFLGMIIPICLLIFVYCSKLTGIQQSYRFWIGAQYSSL